MVRLDKYYLHQRQSSLSIKEIFSLVNKDLLVYPKRLVAAFVSIASKKQPI